jgi:hypothetical protein
MIRYSPTRINIPFDWSVKIEPLYRLFDDTKWMNNFFQTGEIMLSCFNNFRNYPDEMQGDKDEGEAIVGGVSENGDHQAFVYESGMNAYILSTTTKLADEVKKDFKAKCAIKINYPTLFAFEIAKKLPFVAGGLEGRCNYVDYRVNIFHKQQSENKFFQNTDFQDVANLNEQLVELTKGNELFLKQNKYAHQNEYRLIWFSQQKITESIIINCPEAREFCEQINFE